MHLLKALDIMIYYFMNYKRICNYYMKDFIFKILLNLETSPIEAKETRSICEIFGG